jgi:hypothetical protein
MESILKSKEATSYVIQQYKNYTLVVLLVSCAL